ncbi:response regulator [Enterobacter cancerogenus]|uniref:response regulator n=1 Tax=Enterobacter cancerogenus TaxID=69218 RepID=UPI000537A057|nr:response regulator [Enterobacter cancerogenus]KGT91220.1 transcriptional regulator [Enterobacter cancerogenus]
MKLSASDAVKIVFAEDDKDIASALMAYLHREGFIVFHADDGVKAVNYVQEHEPDFVILDIKMPRKDGWTVLADIRHFTDAPVMMLTALDSDADKVYALRTGADDYVVKPFNPSEVIARIHVILRRLRHHVKDDVRQIYETKHLYINQMTHQVLVGPERVDISNQLTSTEYRILLHLIRYPKRVFSRGEILDACLAESGAGERTVDSHISKLRKKLEKSGINFVPESIRGFGYRLGD